jgi:hypothetical protein
MWKRKRRVEGVPSTLRVARIEVVDGLGRVRMVLGDTARPSSRSEAFGIELRDPDGSSRLAARITELGPSLAILASGNVVAMVGHDDEHDEVVGTGAVLQLMNARGETAALWRVESGGEITHVLNPHG